jgi:hypothetical protein
MSTASTMSTGRAFAIALLRLGSWARNSCIASLTTIGVFTPGRMDGVHPDAVRREGVGVGAHQAYDAMLGRGVAEPAAGGPADAIDSGRGAGQHDRVTAALPARCPGDERDLAFELPHDLPSSADGTHPGPVGMPGC